MARTCPRCATGAGARPADALRVLALNAGSSSLKAAILESGTGGRLASVTQEGVEDAAQSLERALASLRRQSAAALEGIEAVGHRIVHGGERLVEAVAVDARVEAGIEACVPLAPLHNPAGLALLRAARSRWPALPHVAVFDTAFHASLSEAARCYALPRTLVEAHGLRRFGFHGINHANVMRRCAEALERPPGALRIVSCHLGAGGSLAAIAGGRSVDTTMGMTPLEGLVMAKRAGDLDPGVLLRLLRDAGLGVGELSHLLNHESGLVALAGTTEMADIERLAHDGDARCGFALEVYVHRLRRHVGAMAGVMGGVDVIAFSGGIGEHAVGVRARACAGLEFLGARFDAGLNDAARVSHEAPVARFSMPGSPVALLVVAADEEREIAADVARVVGIGVR
jgi:acetate kinase